MTEPFPLPPPPEPAPPVPPPACSDPRAVALERARLVKEQGWQRLVAAALEKAGHRAPVLEYPVPGGRVDILLAGLAIEVDFACKWAECVGQALYYGHCTDRTGVCLLILECDADTKYAQHVRDVKKSYDLPLRVWTLDTATSLLDTGHGRSIQV